MDPEKAVRQGDLVDFAGKQVQVVPVDRASDLAAGDSFLDHDLRVVAPCGVHRALELFSAGDLGDAERRPRAGRLHEDGIADLVGVDVLVRRDGPEVRRGDSSAPRDDVREGLVHAHGGALDVAARVGDAGQLQQPLDRPVLAEPAVQNGQHEVQADRLVSLLVQYQQPGDASIR